MKKTILPIFILLLTLTGCAKAIPDQEAAELYIDRVVYQKDKTKFEENFNQGKELNEGFEENEANFQKNFTEGLLSASGEVSKADADEISQLLMDKVKSETTYTAKVKEAGKRRNMEYAVKGLDFAQIMRETTKQLTTKMMKDNALVNDQNKIIQETIVILKDTIAKAEPKEKAVTITLEMEAEKGKWNVIQGQREEIANLYLAFVAGVPDQETLTKEINQAMQDVTKEIQAELAK